MLVDESFTLSGLPSPSSKEPMEAKLKMLPSKYSATETSNGCQFSLSQGPGSPQNRNILRRSTSLSAAPSVVPEESVYTEITELSKRTNDIVSVITSVKTSLRVRVINQVSELFKDVLVEIRHDLNLFDAIYNKQAVKKANIRKWGSTVTKQVKSGSHEIKCSIWDDEVNSPCHTYSIDDMKRNSTRQLYHLVGPESDLIKLKLQCVEKKTADIHQTLTQNIPLQTQESSSLLSHSIGTSYVDDGKTTCSHSLEKSKGGVNVLQTKIIDPQSNFPAVTSNDGGSFRRSSSGTAIDESLFERLRDRDCSLKSHYSSHSRRSIISDLDENDNSTIRSARTTKSIGQSVLEGKTTLRVKISNELSKRSKDLVVDIKSDLSVHESIYEHKSVKSAQVRKWTSDIVKDVKNKVKEVQCVILDGSPEGNPYAAYSIDDLKRLSTKNLHDLIPKSDPVQLVLRCTKVKPNIRSTIQRDSVNSITGLAKRSTRPNHMNLSIIPHSGSFSSFGSSNGSKNYSHADTNASFISEDKMLTRPSCLRSRSSSLNPKSFSKDNSFSLKQMKSDYEDRRSKSAKPSISTFLEDDTLPIADAVIHTNIRSLQHKVQVGSMTASIMHDQEKLNEFKRLCRSKKGREFQSGENLDKLNISGSIQRRRASIESRNSSFESPMCDSRSTSFKTGVSDMRNASFKTNVSDMRDISIKASVTDTRNASLRTIQSDTSESIENHSDETKSKTSTVKRSTLKDSDKISRFLAFSAKKNVPSDGSRDKTIPLTTLSRASSQKSEGSLMHPPLAEIQVFKDHSSDVPAKVNEPSIPLSGDLVKEVFPYHIVIDENFCIIQIGKSLSQLLEEQFLIGKCISDIFTITGPIPSFGNKWDWKVFDKMREKTIFLEGLDFNSFHQKPKIKGSIIELSKTPKRQVLLALSPNVKNLHELEAMNLSMTDLPLHSCQRDAVLLGEHSKSEVKLTNHLDQLHRDLIDSMEKQIEDRTNELATANTNLELANAQLAVQSAKQLEHFACMSHEIRTPLNCIVGMSSLLLEDTEGPLMDPMHADSIRMINTSGDLLKAVVDDVLDYAKLESGAFEVDIKSIKLQDTLDSVLYSISQKVKDKNIRVRTHFTPTVPEYIETDSRRLQQVLFNLLGNAGKFSKADSVIDLSVSLVESSTQNNSNTQSDNKDLIRFSVRDYGKGIEKKDFETIFQPFSQASKETQNIYGGTGLGLSITSKLVQRLGGTISLDSEYGKFTDFTVDLPMNGAYIEVEMISKSLKNTTIVLIEPKEIEDNIFRLFPFKTEPLPLDLAVVDAFGLNVIRCHSVDEFKKQVSVKHDTSIRQHFSLLVHEKLHESCSLEKLGTVLGQSRYSLMTYGANFLVGKTRASHFKSLSELFPATLLQSIAKQNDEQERFKTKARGLSSSSGLSSSPMTNTSTGYNKEKNAEGSACSSKPHHETKSKSSKIPSSSRQSKTNQNDFRKDLKVLYAEDNLVNQKVLSRVLQRSGITDITIVDNGKKAVDISETVKYDCILLDMQMPVMDGMEACEIIMERDPNTIIVFVTAHALDEFKAKATAAGARGFISKPFRVGDIDKVLNEIYAK